MHILKTCATAVLLALSVQLYATAQDGENPLSYSSMALRAISDVVPISGSNAIIPSVSDANGIASFIDNPASMALVEKSYFSFGYTMVGNFDQVTSFGNQATKLNRNLPLNNNGLLTEAGFVRNVPTSTGDLSFGISYALQQDFHRNSKFNAFNINSSITDNFKLSGSNSLPFEVFATDWNNQNNEYVESIFRIGQTSEDEFLGIYQDGEIQQSGFMGDISAFGATEFFKNFIIGASIGTTIGRYTISRTIIEEDLDNIYNIDLIDDDFNPNTPGTDIDLLQFNNRIEAEINGFTFRMGVIYKLNKKYQFGASLTFPTSLRIDEKFSESSESIFDNGFGYIGEDSGKSYYYISRPKRYRLGATAYLRDDVKISIATDFINYSDVDVDELGFGQDYRTNEYIRDHFVDVINLRFGSTYALNKKIKLRASYAYLPSKTNRNTINRNIFGGGLSYELNRRIILDLNMQYSEYDDRSVLYDYENFNGPSVDEIIDQKIRRLIMLSSLRLVF